MCYSEPLYEERKKQLKNTSESTTYNVSLIIISVPVYTKNRLIKTNAHKLSDF